MIKADMDPADACRPQLRAAQERAVYCTPVRTAGASPNHGPPKRVSFARFPQESWLLASTVAFTRNGLSYWERCERTAGIVHTRLFWKQVYIVTAPEAIEDVLVTHAPSFTKPFGLRRMKVVFGNGLLVSEGDHWQQHRHHIKPAFGPDRTAALIEFARHRAEALAAAWRDGGERDFYPDLLDVFLDNLAHTMFGGCDAELKRTTRAAAEICQDIAHSGFRAVRPSQLLYPGRLKRRLDTAMRELHAYLSGLIDRRIAEAPRDDFLGLLLRGDGHHPPMPRQDVLDESVTMLLAGHETAAAALVWALYLLARHPEHADTLARDLAAQLQGAAPSAETLPRLTSLRQTVDETLRLYPPTHRIGRTVIAPVDVGGHKLPVGAEVVLPQWAVHRSARWYDRPDMFVPGRWTAAFRRELPKFAYFPFSGGPRSCLGTQFVLLEAAIVLGVLAQHFRFSMLPGAAELAPFEGLTLLPAGRQLRLRMERRTH